MVTHVSDDGGSVEFKIVLKGSLNAVIGVL